MTVLFPKCECGGTVVSAESEHFQTGHRNVRNWLFRETMVGNAHPYLKLATLAVGLGHEVYKRVPGGGQKECTSCGKIFR